MLFPRPIHHKPKGFIRLCILVVTSCLLVLSHSRSRGGRSGAPSAAGFVKTAGTAPVHDNRVSTFSAEKLSDDKASQKTLVQQPAVGTSQPLTAETEAAPSTTTHAKPPVETRHPVKILHARAARFFDSMISRQSQTLDTAIAEYKRRYSRSPPPGFDEWFEYAQSVGSPIIDDFDTLDDGIAPFYFMSAKKVRDLMAAAFLPLQNGGVKPCRFEGGRFPNQTTCRSDWMYDMTAQLGEAAKRVPNVTLLMNLWDEPSVLPLPDEKDGDPEEKDDDGGVYYTKMSGMPIARLVAEACKMGSYKRGAHAARAKEAWGEVPETLGVPFVTDVADTKNLCKHPEYKDQHGFLISPSSLFHMPARVPIVSQAAPMPFQDILLPPGPYSRAFAVDKTVWEEKESALYWAGTTTGSFARNASEDSWRLSHRQRAVLFGMHDDKKREFTYLSPKADGGYEPHRTRNFVRGMFNLSIVHTAQCEAKACEAQQKVFGPFHRTDPAEPFGYKFVLDIDGNSYTGRYYRLLASNSAVLKMTILREWHDERLVPWLHYIPVSQSLDELAELMRFLATTPEGQAVGKNIAQAGEDWYNKALSKVHQGVYLYRLFLEMAWLQDDKREIFPVPVAASAASEMVTEMEVDGMRFKLEY